MQGTHKLNKPVFRMPHTIDKAGIRIVSIAIGRIFFALILISFLSFETEMV